MLHETAARAKGLICAKARRAVMRQRKNQGPGRTGASIGWGFPALLLYLIATTRSAADFENVGQVHAFAALTGRPIWSFKTVLTPDKPGNDSWGGNGDVSGLPGCGVVVSLSRRVSAIRAIRPCVSRLYRYERASLLPSATRCLPCWSCITGAAALSQSCTSCLFCWANHAPMLSGETPSASGVVFTGSGDGHMLAFEAKTGRLLFGFDTGGTIAGGISTYMIGGRQFVAVASGNTSKALWQTSGVATLVVFGLP